MKLKEKKSNKETKAMTKKKEKKATPSKFIEIIKKKWLVDTSKTSSYIYRYKCFNAKLESNSN